MTGVLYGLNMGRPVAALPLAPPALAAAAAGGYDLQAYRFQAAPEQLRPPRVVRIGLVQNSIKVPTTAPFLEQRAVRAAAAGVGVGARETAAGQEGRQGSLRACLAAVAGMPSC